MSHIPYIHPRDYSAHDVSIIKFNLKSFPEEGHRGTMQAKALYMSCLPENIGKRYYVNTLGDIHYLGHTPDFPDQNFAMDGIYCNSEGKAYSYWVPDARIATLIHTKEPTEEKGYRYV